MKETNTLEMQLQSWELRRPSATLRRRIFGESPRLQFITATFRWLAPAAACALLTVALLNQGGGPATHPVRRDSIVAVIASNQFAVASLSNDLLQAGSTVPASSFESTNRSGSASSIGSLPSPK